MQYYNGNKILTTKDLNGKQPEIFIIDGNRTSGKTTFFNKFVFSHYLETNEKFCLLYRFNYELDQVAEKFFKDIQELFYPQFEMTDKSQSKGMYHELFIKNVSRETNDNNDTVSCGYAIALNNADQIKKMSHLFSDCGIMLFDEFQSETGHYCNNEIQKFQSIHTSLARGKGKQTKYLPVIMISNSTSSINPYYTALGISERLQENTKILKGNGFVLERNYNESAANAISDSAFVNAFSDSDYSNYATGNKYLNDSNTFIENIKGKGKYVFTLKSYGKEYGVIEYADLGIIYVTTKADLTFPYKIAIDVTDHDVNYVLLSKYDEYISKLRFFFNRGCFRFKNLQCKNAIMKLLNYKLL